MTQLLVIAGLDPSGGAGFLADARVAAELGVRATGVVTALTVQDTQGARAANPAPPEVVADQLRVLLADVEVDAVKIGMLGDERIALAVVDALAATRAPVVWDPVLLASRGGVPLLAGDLARVARALLPEARLVTPNLAEAEALTGEPVRDVDGMKRAARALQRAGAAAVLVKGGHLGGARSPDVLLDGDAEHVLDGPRLDAGATHGTGCVLSTAIACHLAGGAGLLDAVRAARDLVAAKLAAPLSPGRGARSLV